MNRTRMFSVFSVFLLLVLLLGPGAQPAAAGGGGVVFTVNSPLEGSDALLNGVCATSGGVCTLRAAIQEANNDPNVNTINFNLSGGGMHILAINAGPLPALTNQVYLDGTTQPGCSAPCILVSGAIVGGGYSGLYLSANDSLIRGFVVTSWGGYGILVYGNRNKVEGNRVGIWPGNPTDLGNAGGISLLGSNNVIGGTTAAARNVIADNNWHGIVLANGSGLATSNNLIQGNYIGTDETGLADRGNNGSGIYLFSNATYTTIGGSVAGARNVISGNLGAGIGVAGPHTTIRGNFIGIQADGTGPLANDGDGIRILSTTSTANIIGGATNSARNRISYNMQNGILIDFGGTGRTTIRRNSIFSNWLRGIDLNNDNVTPNDGLDGDTGPNGLQNFPIVSSATSSTKVIVAKLNSKPGTTYRIEFFSSPAGSCDPGGHGEGRTFLGSLTGTTNGTGYVKVIFTSPVAFPVGAIITTTATDAGGRTSEFSACKTAS